MKTTPPTVPPFLADTTAILAAALQAQAEAGRQFLAALGRRGGRAGVGARKARTSEQARAAARARWAKHREKHEG